MWIDAHHHLWDLNAVEYPWLMAQGVRRFFGDPTPIQRNFLMGEFKAMAVPNDVRSSVHIQVGAADGMAEAHWVQSVADAHPDWPLAQVVFCDLTAPDRDQNLDGLSALPTVRGVRQIVGRAPGENAATGTNALLGDPRFVEGLRAAGERRLSFDLQLIPELMAETAAVLREAPNTAIALCHAGSPHDRTPAGLARWADQLSALSALPQVYCKLSGLGMFDHQWTVDRLRPIIETCLDQFGAGRCMFGSNFPVDSLYSDYKTLFNGVLSLVPARDHQAVFHDTAARFYQLGP